MRFKLLCVALFAVSSCFGQAFDGEGDSKLTLGASFQKDGFGVSFFSDQGLSDYISMGYGFGFIVKSKELPPEFQDAEEALLLMEKLDLTVRFNGHFAELLKLGDKSDLYAGVNLKFRNVGGQLGYRFLLTEDFGFYAEGEIPFFKYKIMADEPDYYDFYNQPVLNAGLVFNL